MRFYIHHFPFYPKFTESTVSLPVTFVKVNKKEFADNSFLKRSYRLGKREKKEFHTPKHLRVKAAKPATGSYDLATN